MQSEAFFSFNFICFFLLLSSGGAVGCSARSLRTQDQRADENIKRLRRRITPPLRLLQIEDREDSESAAEELPQDFPDLKEAVESLYTRAAALHLVSEKPSINSMSDINASLSHLESLLHEQQPTAAAAPAPAAPAPAAPATAEQEQQLPAASAEQQQQLSSALAEEEEAPQAPY